MPNIPNTGKNAVPPISMRSVSSKEIATVKGSARQPVKLNHEAQRP